MSVIRSNTFSFEEYLQPRVENYRLRHPSASTADVVDMFYGDQKNEGETMPWPKTHAHIRFRPGEVTIWCGVNGHGKSQITSQVALGFACQSERSLLMSFEMLPKRTLWRMCRQASGLSEPPIRYIKGFLSWADQWIYILDHQGIVTPELVYGAIRYAALTHKIQHFFVDSLMKLSRGETDYDQQKDVIDSLCAIARELRVHIHVVHHVRKTENEFMVPGKFDAKGSGSITDQVDNFITVWRNKRKEVEARKLQGQDQKVMSEPDCVLNIDKQRNGEWEGTIGLWFSLPAMSYVEEAGGRPMRIEIDDPSVMEVP